MSRAHRGGAGSAEKSLLASAVPIRPHLEAKPRRYLKYFTSPGPTTHSIPHRVANLHGAERPVCRRLWAATQLSRDSPVPWRGPKTPNYLCEQKICFRICGLNPDWSTATEKSQCR